jgi:hypothetical protein
MQAKTLKQPGKFASAERLRREVANAISIVEVAKAHGAVGQGALLSDFLHDAAAKTPNAVAPVVSATQFVLNSGVKINGVAITGTGNFATPTIVGGVITGIVLSAS